MMMMRNSKIFQFIFYLSTFFTFIHASRYYCYKGSSLYQIEYVDCGDLVESAWYCSRITVCEDDIDAERECIETRGCATPTECTNPRTGQIFKGERVNGNGTQPAGMKIAITCCKASKFADDDALAIDMSEICNSSTRVVAGAASFIVALLVAMVLAFN